LPVSHDVLHPALGHERGWDPAEGRLRRLAIQVLVPSLAFFLLFGCGRGNSNGAPPGFNAKGTIPQPEYLQSNQTTVPVRLLSPNVHGSEGLEDSTWLTRFPPERAVGELDSGGPGDLGDLADAAVTSAGEVIILDRSFGTLRVFDRTGTLLQTARGFGGGPGEFQDPLAVSLTEGDTILVADLMALIHRFVRLEGGWEFLDRIRIEGVTPKDVCKTDGKIFALGSRYTSGPQSEEWSFSFEGSIHQITRDGSVAQSFSVPYRSENSLVVERLADGVLACDPAGGRLWVGYGALGEVHAFTADGGLRWIARVGDFEHSLLVDDQGGIVPDSRPGRLDILNSLFLASPDALLLNIDTWRFGDAGMARDSLSRFVALDPETGERIAEGMSARLLGGSDGTVVAAKNDPFPQFVILSADNGGGERDGP